MMIEKFSDVVYQLQAGPNDIKKNAKLGLNLHIGWGYRHRRKGSSIAIGDSPQQESGPGGDDNVLVLR